MCDVAFIGTQYVGCVIQVMLSNHLAFHEGKQFITNEGECLVFINIPSILKLLLPLRLKMAL